MKMSKESYCKLKDLIKNVSEKHTISSHRDFIVKEGKAKDIERRLRWDYFSAATRGHSDFITFLYNEENLYDSHIDTALKGIFKDLQA